jgi:hypothetical protein
LTFPDLATALQGHKTLAIYQTIKDTGKPNYQVAKIPLKSGLNIKKWRQYLQPFPIYKDLLNYLTYGFPVNYVSDHPPTTEKRNHSSADLFPNHIDSHIDTELRHSALLGPFSHPPFQQWSHSSPLMTRPQKGSANRRVITDLSWPIGASVNSSVPRDEYQGHPNKTVLPTLQDILALVRHFGRNSYLYSIDVARAYSQLRVDPLDWPLQGIQWAQKYYTATSVQFGSRWGAYACQLTQTAVCDILKSEGITAIVYIDDYLLIGRTLTAAQKGFSRAKELTSELGIDRSTPKDQPPTQLIHFIGYLIDTVQMIVSIDPIKIQEIIQLLTAWKSKTTATKHQLQQILGKLHYVSRCCPPARLFVGRMLFTLRMASDKGHVRIGTSFQADITWFLTFLPQYNGVHLINPPKKHCAITCQIHDQKAVTSYLENVYSFDIPAKHHYSTLQCRVLWTIFICAKLWASKWSHTHVIIHSPSTKAATVINTGASRHDNEMQLARNIWLLSSVHEFTINVDTQKSDQPLKKSQKIVHLQVNQADQLHESL